MDRTTESDSEEDAQDFNDGQLNSLVLRPAIISLPSITDDPDSEEDSSSVHEVVFSNINWASQDLTESLLDHVLPSPAPSRSTLTACQLNEDGTAERSARAPTPRSPTLPVPLESAASLTVFKVQPHVDDAVGDTHSGAQPCLPTPSLSLTGTESGEPKPSRINEPDDPYEGQGWLSGAAGRLAGGLERRRAPLTATDEEQVAAAAQAATDLRQQQRQQQAVSSQEGGATAGEHTAAQSDDEEAVLQLHRQREQAEEQRIARDFHEAVQAAEMEPPLLAPSGLRLEATVAGLEMDDLDALIARLSAGTADLQPAVAATDRPALAGQATGGPSAGAGPSSLSWSLDLPAADSLWSDDDEPLMTAIQRQQVAVMMTTQPQPSAPAEDVTEDTDTPVGSMVATAATAPAVPAVAHVSASQPPTAQGLSSESTSIAGPDAPSLAAQPQSKFKFFAGPVAGGQAHSAKGLAIPARRGAAPTGGSGPVVMDLRQSISEVVQRNSREAAAAAALRDSAAKAAAAQRRLMAASSDSDDDDNEEGVAAAAASRGPAPGGPRVQLAAAAKVTGPAAAAATTAAATSSYTADIPTTDPVATTAPAPGTRVSTLSTSSGGTCDLVGSSKPIAAPTPVGRTPSTTAAAAAAGSVGPAPAAPAASKLSFSKTTTVNFAGAASAVSTPSLYSDNNGAATATTSTAATNKPPVAATATAGVSVGTDAADLRPASRSIFVCTAERETEEAERAADIREYLKARRAAADAAAAATAAAQREAAHTQSGVEQGSRSWPEPPAEVLERINSVLSSQRKTVTPNVDTGSNHKHPQPRAVASFAGGGDVVADFVPTANKKDEVSNHVDGGANGKVSVMGAASQASSSAPASNGVPALPSGEGTLLGSGMTSDVAQATACQVAGGESAGTSAAVAPAPPRVFAACSTEGDEDLVAPPLPASVVDASLERGARRAVAGTFIPSSHPVAAEAAVAARGVTGARKGDEQECKAGSTSSSSDNTAPWTAASASIPSLQVPSHPKDADSRPSALQLPSPTLPSHTSPPAPASTNSLTPSQSQTTHALSPSAPAASGPGLPANAPAAPQALPSHRGSADGTSNVAHAANARSPRATATSPADLGRLPAWLPPSSCFTLLLTAPGNMSTMETAAILAWLLQLAAAAPPAKDGSSPALAAPSKRAPGMPAFSIVGLRLLGVTPTWELLPAAAAIKPGATPVTGADVRVLAAACVPRAGLDPDTYNHELSATAASDAASATDVAQQLATALTAVSWSDVLPTLKTSSGTGDAQGVPGEEKATRALMDLGSLGAWSAVLPGASEALFGTLRLSPHALSHHQARSDGPTSPASSGVRSLAHHDNGVLVGSSSTMGAADSSLVTFACMATSGGLRSPGLLLGLLTRAAAAGLTLRGLQMVYAAEEAAAAVVAATPHRPMPYIGAAVMALCGRNDPLRRWQAQLGPAVDARLAAVTDPRSLHALYGDVARHITCSYDAVTAAREVSVLFDVPQAAPPTGAPVPSLSSAAAAAPSQQRGKVPSSRATVLQASTGAALPPPPPAAAAAPTTSLTSSGVRQSQYLVLPACGAEQQYLALWCMQHALFCGYSLRGLLLTSAPLPQPTSQQQQQPPNTSLGSSSPSLVMELSNEEAPEQLPLLLTHLPPAPLPPHAPHSAIRDSVAPSSAVGLSTPAGEGHPTAPQPLHHLPLRGSLFDRPPVSDMHNLPQPHLADQLLQHLAGPAAASEAVGSVGSSAEGPNGVRGTAHGSLGRSSSHRDEDEVAVVAVQARTLHVAALLLAALTAHVTGSEQLHSAEDKSLAGQPPPSPWRPSVGRLELVACRYLRQVPSEVANRLPALQCPSHTPQHYHGGGAVAGAAAGVGTAAECSGCGQRPQQRLVISQPALLAAFHGPAAQTRVAELLTLALTWLQQSTGPTSSSSSTLPSSVSAAATAVAAAAVQEAEQQQPDTVAWISRLTALLRDYPTAATGLPPLAALSCSQAGAKHALAHAFSPAHVFLDAGMHNGIHRPPLPATTPATVAAAAAASSAAATTSPLGWLLSGPERLPAIVALDFAALHRNLLPRLLKQLWREGYTLHAATTVRLQPEGAASAVFPALAGQPAMVLHISRSNAVAHLRALAAALAPAAAAGSGGGLHTCRTWRDVVCVLNDVWPPATNTGDGSPLAPSAGGSSRRFVRPEGSRLLQLTAMVATPNAQALTDGGSPSLDWPHLADALEVLHTEGFRLAAVRALSATPRDITHLARATYRITPAQQRAIQAVAAAADTSAAVGGLLNSTASGGGSEGMSPATAGRATEWFPSAPPPCNLVLLALSRDNAVTSLQILLDEAGRCGGGGAGQRGQQPPGVGVRGGAVGAAAAGGAGQAGGAVPLSRGGVSGRRDAAAALGPVAHCLSVSHSPAAAEQQMCAAFEGVFGPGGVALMR